MNATDNKLPMATGSTPENGAGVQLKNPPIIINLHPIDVNAKCRNERNTMKLNPSFSVMYLFIITTPTTERIFPTIPITTVMSADPDDIFKNTLFGFLTQSVKIFGFKTPK